MRRNTEEIPVYTCKAACINSVAHTKNTANVVSISKTIINNVWYRTRLPVYNQVILAAAFGQNLSSTYFNNIIFCNVTQNARNTLSFVASRVGITAISYVYAYCALMVKLVVRSAPSRPGNRYMIDLTNSWNEFLFNHPTYQYG